MPAARPQVIVNAVIDAIQQSGSVTAYVSESLRTHPRKFAVSYLGQTYSLWLYIWTLTHGGRVSLPNEYRIQMTSVASPLDRNPNGLTALMGYCPDLKMFAGFDLKKHCIFTEGSPSVQIDIAAIYEARQSGLSFAAKDSNEIAIGVRPDHFWFYCLNADNLHLHGVEDNLAAILTKVIEIEEVPQQEITELVAERKQIVEKVHRYSRSAKFRRQVMSAYGNRCAVTGMQLRLVDAAHILPVTSDGSSDHVTNGIALAPTFHRAYDTCLIYLDENFVMKLNEEKIEELVTDDLGGEIHQFRSFLDKTIYLPVDMSQRPRLEYIAMANRHRRIRGYV
ncbi:MAG: HNH endonuclease [Caldilineaceae bacterium SB0662_bin_9]|uniref:HNH endonuclease n=1 Tax=Caldilineaceae bacterium SB0662_bin_9 TaxID=2605258 RepID=A0A6B1DV48_9CHLR|nr:HNH endonuclease [Caldilineaceae bacterium SB0662_bin_9]